MDCNTVTQGPALKDPGNDCMLTRQKDFRTLTLTWSSMMRQHVCEQSFMQRMTKAIQPEMPLILAPLSQAFVQEKNLSAGQWYNQCVQLPTSPQMETTGTNDTRCKPLQGTCSLRCQH